MSELIVISATALWLGILTSISPCPLATSIAAVSFIGKSTEHPRFVLFAGLLYTSGRVLTYVVMGALLVSSILAAPAVSQFLQVYLNKILGPLMILVGMVLVDLLNFKLGRLQIGSKVQGHAKRMGLWGALPLGMIFALSFCPISAALFFGSLIPLAAKTGSPFYLPLVYGIGTALPVIAFALLIAFGTHVVAKTLDQVKKIEHWARLATGIIFILVGIYLSLAYIFELI